MTSGVHLGIEMVEVNCVDRWRVYQRLQELAIPCWCATHQPLRVHILDATAAIQLWSVSKQFTMSRQESIYWLERCLHNV